MVHQRPRVVFVVSFVLGVLAAAGGGVALAQAPGPAHAELAKKMRVLLVTQSKGFDHEVVQRKDGKPSLVETTFEQMAARSGLFTVVATRDASVITPEKLKDVDVVVFYTTGVLPFKVE